MKNYRMHAPSSRPTKADLKFARQDSKMRCFAPKKGPGAVCINMTLHESDQTPEPKNPSVFQGSPEDFFNSAIGSVPSRCDAKALESATQCTSNGTYHFDYSLATQPGKLFRDYTLNVDTHACQNQTQAPNDLQLFLCTKEGLDQAAAQSAASFDRPTGLFTPPLYESLLAVASGIGLVALCFYCCVRKQTTPEQRERQSQQREALLLAEHAGASGQPRAYAVSQPHIGAGPRVL